MLDVPADATSGTVAAVHDHPGGDALPARDRGPLAGPARLDPVVDGLRPLAHDRALQLMPEGATALQLPLVMTMVVFTVGGLALLFSV